MSQGNLFSDYFLSDGVALSADWPALARRDLAAIQAAIADLIADFEQRHRPNEANTESDLVEKLLDLLGWEARLKQEKANERGRLDIPDYLLFRAADDKAEAARAPSGRYRHGAAILEAKAWDVPLDKAEPGEAGAPSTQILRYLGTVDVQSEGAVRFGILTNGRVWRLYDHKARSRLEGFVEIDLTEAAGTIVPAEQVPEDHAEQVLRRFLFLFGRDAFVPDAGGATRLTRAIADSRGFEARVTDNLADTVFATVFPDLANALAAADPERPAELSPAYLAELREAALTWLYRLLFVLYAEDRSLLPTRNRRDGLWATRNEVARAVDGGEALSTRRTNYDGDLRDLWRQIDGGDKDIGLPPYNGGLFKAGGSPLLDRAVMPDAAFAPLLDALSRQRLGERPRFINYRDLNVQHLGSVYERLLEFDLAEVDGANVPLDGPRPPTPSPEGEGERRIVARPQTFARKTSGSYYTPEELVMLVIRRTVGPLLEEREQAFASAAEAEARKRQASEAPEYPLARLAELDPATAFLKLRICDPAMGSGHFLVSLVDYLADRTLEATQWAAEQVGFGAYRSPLLARLETIRERILAEAKTHGWRVHEAQLVDRQLVRRIILKRVIHGVDKNPMAVELAKLSLWLHTFTVGAPLSFLDHHLRRGDSLFGEWTRDALDRLGQDRLYRNESIDAAERAIGTMATIEEMADADIAEVQASAEQFAEMEEHTHAAEALFDLVQGYRWLQDSADSARKEAKRLERESVRTTGDEAFELARQADRLKRKGRALEQLIEGNYGPVERALDMFYGRVTDTIPLKANDDLAVEQLRRAASLSATVNFLHWELAFPNVWSRWRDARPQGGFDAVIGNPPWDRLKLQEVEWFAARKPEVAFAVRAADRKRLIARLKDEADPLAEDYARATEMATLAAKMATAGEDKGGQYPLLGRGDVNLYSLFVERAARLVNPRGIVGLLTPSGIAGDLGASAFFREVSTGGRLGSLLDYANRPRESAAPFFEDVDSRFKFCVLVFGGAERDFAAAECGFFLPATDDAALADGTFPLAPADFAAVNPNTGTAPVFRTPRDADLTTAIYARVPVLADHNVAPALRPWRVRYLRMFDMTNDSHLFRTRAELEEDGWYPVVDGHWRKGTAEAVPLYVGRMFHQFDHRAASVTVNEENLHNAANSEAVSAEDKADPAFSPEPQYWVEWKDVEPKRPWALAFRDIARPTDARTVIASLLPQAAFGNTAALLLDLGAPQAALLAANLNSFGLDFVARQKVQGTHVNWYILEQLPVIPPEAYDRAFGALTAREIVEREVLRLTYTAHDMAAFARDMGWVYPPPPGEGDRDAAGGGVDGHAGHGEPSRSRSIPAVPLHHPSDGPPPRAGEDLVKPPFAWDEADRRQRRARLDALYFHLYGIGREDADYILSTFPIVRRHDEAEFGRYLTRDLILAQMAALEAGDCEAEVVAR